VQAREGSLSSFYGPEPALGLTYAVQRTTIRSYFTKKHDTLWKNLITCKHSRDIIIGQNIYNTKYLLNLSKSSLRTLIGVITGHCKLNKHMNRLGLSQTTVCRCDEEDETPLHILTSCPAVALDRLKLMELAFPTSQQIKNIKLNIIHDFAKKYCLYN